MSSESAKGHTVISKVKGTDDFHEYEIAKCKLDAATEQLSTVLCSKRPHNAF